MQAKKIIILVLSHNEEPFIKLEAGIRETWANQKYDDIKVFYYYGAGESERIEEDRIVITFPEGYSNIGYKTMRAFELVYDNYEFDYIFRTNSSSYINIVKFREYIVDKPTKNFYHGVIGIHRNNFWNPINFASGCGYFLSKDVVKKIIDNKSLWNHNCGDDVALSILLKKLKIYPSAAPRIDVNSTKENNFYLNGKLIAKSVISQHFHFRCKTIGDRNMDIEIMKKLNEILQ